jgi:hypothetical protein
VGIVTEDQGHVPAAEQTTTPSQLPSGDLFTTLKNWYLADRSHWSAWMTEAKQAYDFVAGHGQWSTDERQFLLSEAGGKRQPITFNLALTFVKAVCGIEIGSRHDIVFLPRNTSKGVAAKNEVLTGASEYMADETSAGRVESRAFQDAVKTGMGYIETGLDYDRDPDGGYLEERVSPLEMLVDCKARKDNCLDARRMFHTKADLPLAEVRAMFPLVDDPGILDASWANKELASEDPTPKEERVNREENSHAPDEKTTVTLVRAQWWEREKYMRLADPSNPQTTKDVSLAEWDQIKKQLEASGAPPEAIRAVPQTRKVYKQAWLGATILPVGGTKEKPVYVQEAPCKTHFSWKVITGEPDENKGIWYGMVRVLHDPQKWANKWLTQFLHILNSTAKGGVIFEDGAIDDMPDFLESYAQVDKPTKVAAGAISQSKLIPKPGAQLGDGYIKLVEFALGIIPKVTGINLEILGLREVNQPGVLEAQRKQAGMTILATLFDSLKQCRKSIGETRLYLIQQYLADGRWVRIVGEEGAQYVQLAKDQVAGRYDVIVEDAPTSPNQKEQTWQLLQPMMAAWKDELAANPELFAFLMEYSPLPTRVVEGMKKIMGKPNPEAEQQKAITMAGAKAKVAKDQAGAAKDAATAKKTEVETLISVLEAGLGVMRAKREKNAPVIEHTQAA